MTITDENSGQDMIPIFTSPNEAYKGEPPCLMRLFPKDYLPIIRNINKVVILNPFGKHMVVPIDLLWIKYRAKEFYKSKYDFLKDIDQNKYIYIGQIFQRDTKKLREIKMIQKKGSFPLPDAGKKKVSEEISQLYIREPYIRRRLIQNKGIPSIVDLYEDEEYICMITEDTEGITLDQLLDFLNDTELSISSRIERLLAFIKWMKELAMIVDYLHTRKPAYIHRNITLDNIKITRDANLLLLGYEYLYRMKVDPSPMTPLWAMKYSPPELLEGKIGVETDIYFIGVVMYSVCTGIDPCSNELPINQRLPIQTVNHDIPLILINIIDKCLKNDPKDRYHSAKVLLKDLQKCEKIVAKQVIRK